MAVRIGVRRIRRQDGKIYLLFSDKVGREFENLAALRSWAGGADLDSPEVLEILRRLLVRWALHRDDTAPASAIEGKEIRLDLQGATLLEVL